MTGESTLVFFKTAASAQTRAVLIDVSDPTANLLWEMEQLRRSSKKCVFIAERDHLRISNDRGPEERTEIISSIIYYYLLLRSSIMMLCLSIRHNQRSAARHFDRVCVSLCHW